MNPAPRFLNLAKVLRIHEDQIRRYGGSFGVRDLSLLESALAMPESTFEGRYLHEDLFAMAAAYAFHISQNHPFLDGNKRTALAAALVFLDLNGIVIQDPDGSLYGMMIGAASGRMGKVALREELRRLGG